MNLDSRRKKIAEFFNGKCAGSAPKYESRKEQSDDDQTFYVRFFGGPIDGVEGIACQVFKNLFVPINFEMVDRPVTASWGLSGEQRITSVSRYVLRVFNNRLYYVFDRSLSKEEFVERSSNSSS